MAPLPLFFVRVDSKGVKAVCFDIDARDFVRVDSKGVSCGPAAEVAGLAKVEEIEHNS
jgi:hypothetical protein